MIVETIGLFQPHQPVRLSDLVRDPVVAAFFRRGEGQRVRGQLNTTVRRR